MFKVIRDYVKPQFLVICDASCICNVSSFFEPGAVAYEDAQLTAFAVSLVKSDWKITVNQQLCPSHYRRQDNSALLNLDCGDLKN